MNSMIGVPRVIIVATLFTIDELQQTLTVARATSNSLPQKEKAKVMHSTIEKVASQKGYLLKLKIGSM